jgi:hypothetical protein
MNLKWYFFFFLMKFFEVIDNCDYKIDLIDIKKFFFFFFFFLFFLTIKYYCILKFIIIIKEGTILHNETSI